MDDRNYLPQASNGLAEDFQPVSELGRRSRRFRVALNRAIKKARKLVKRNLTQSEIEMLENEVAKYA